MLIGIRDRRDTQTHSARAGPLSESGHRKGCWVESEVGEGELEAEGDGGGVGERGRAKEGGERDGDGRRRGGRDVVDQDGPLE